MTTYLDDEWIVLEVPHRYEARAYSGYGRAMYLDGTYCAADRGGTTVFEKTTATELLRQYGLGTDADPDDIADADAAWVADLGRKHGWATAIYRADALIGEGVYQADPVDEVEAAVAYNAHDLSAYYLASSAAECRELLERLEGPNAPRIGKCGPVRAAAALPREAERIGWLEPAQDDDEDDEPVLPSGPRL